MSWQVKLRLAGARRQRAFLTLQHLSSGSWPQTTQLQSTTPLVKHFCFKWQKCSSMKRDLMTLRSSKQCNRSYEIPYILESNLHPFYSFSGPKNQMWIRIACGLDLRSWAGFWKNDRAAVRVVRTIQHNNLLFYLFIILYNILYNIYNLLFIRLAVITHNWISLPCRQGAVEGKVRIRTAN